MGHANVQTTMRYLHYKSKADAARRLSEAFTEETPPDAILQTQTGGRGHASSSADPRVSPWIDRN